MTRTDTKLIKQTLETQIPKVVRLAVIQRDERCVGCGRAETLGFGYIIPPAEGGATVLGNLRLVCSSCVALNSWNRQESP